MTPATTYDVSGSVGKVIGAQRRPECDSGDNAAAIAEQLQPDQRSTKAGV